MSSAVVKMLRGDPAVRAVEPDYTVDVASTQSGPPSWGLDRVDQRPRTTDGRYDYVATGAGVTTYMIDTGIRASHREFGGRVGSGFSTVADGRGTGDCNGHGTHTAAAAGGATYGIAKEVTLVPVRVLSCEGEGEDSDLIKGIDWVTGQVGDWQAAHPGEQRAFVVNMSLGDDAKPAVDMVIKYSIQQFGITYVVAADNENGDVCDRSPAGVADAITVDDHDDRASFSNYGKCVDIWAPGVDIRSASNGSDSASMMLSGTSMATPHVAGAAALYLQQNPAATPAQVSAAIVGAATSGILHDLKGSADKLLYTPALGGVPNRGPSMGTPGAALTGGQAGAVTLALPAAGGLRPRDRAVDSGGNVGPWATGASRDLALHDQGGWSFAKSSTWKTSSRAGALNNSVRRTKSKNSSATLKFTGRQIAWIATMAKDRGRATVYLDGKQIDTVDLYSSSTSLRRLVFLGSGLSAGTHTLKVVVLGKGRNSKARYVDVDGWTTLN